MNFYVIMRRETGNYIAPPDIIGGVDETEFVSMAVSYSTRKSALAAAGPNTCVCGPYPTDEYEGKPASGKGVTPDDSGYSYMD